MNISPNYNCTTPQNYQNRNNSTNFTAIPKASYKLFKGTGDVVIYQLERSDVPFLEHLRANIDKFFEKSGIKDHTKREIIEEALRGGVDFLKDTQHPQGKAKVLLAVADKEPCGLLVGNGLKIDKRGKYLHSSRKNHGAKETELDFFATWNNETRKGTGSALIDQYFRSAKADGFHSIYVRSEVPQNSNATTFYSKNGFRSLIGDRQMLDPKKGDSGYVTSVYFDTYDVVAPMKVTAGRMNTTIAETSKAMGRKEAANQASRDLSDIISTAP